MVGKEAVHFDPEIYCTDGVCKFNIEIPPRTKVSVR